MNDNHQVLLKEAKAKVGKSFALVEASIGGLKPYDANCEYSFKELEPYDALADRFIRAVETFIKFFRSYDIFQNQVPQATYRDLLNLMAKLELIDNTETWFKMRAVRNKIVHDYLLEQTKLMFDDIMGKFYRELIFSRNKIDLILA